MSSYTNCTSVLSDYYTAMNAHDVDAALLWLSPDVLVTFPEAERNWQGISLAREKFKGMFERMPGFVGTFEIVSVSSDNGESLVIDKVNAACNFKCTLSQTENTRNMVYHIHKQLIIEIHHL